MPRRLQDGVHFRPDSLTSDYLHLERRAPFNITCQIHINSHVERHIQTPSGATLDIAADQGCHVTRMLPGVLAIEQRHGTFQIFEGGIRARE